MVTLFESLALNCLLQARGGIRGIVLNLNQWGPLLKNKQTEQKRIQTKILQGENGHPVAFPDFPGQESYSLETLSDLCIYSYVYCLSNARVKRVIKPYRTEIPVLYIIHFEIRFNPFRLQDIYKRGILSCIPFFPWYFFFFTEITKYSRV